MNKNPQTYKKLVSLNPKKWEMINTNKAVADYTRYLKLFVNDKYWGGAERSLLEAKTFKEWLRTEI